MADNVEMITLLFGAFGNSDEKRMAIYCRLLNNVPSEVLSAVIEKAITESKFLPSIAELKEHCKSLALTVTGEKVVPDWGEAWQEINKAMLRTPWGQSPTFSHPAIAEAVNQYGWHNLHTCLAEEMGTVRAQIRRMYDEAAARFVEKVQNEQILSKNPMLAQQCEDVKRIGGSTW